MDEVKHQHNKVKISVSGAAETGHCGAQAMERAKEIGREIYRQGGVLITGATTGFPLWATMGIKEVGGTSIGFSPASNEDEHVNQYGLPIDYLDVIVYTGFGYSGRNLLLTRSSDGVIVGCGRVGTINEFTVAFEDGKPIGVLEGEWETDEVIKDIMQKGHRQNERVIFDRDPKNLVKRLIEMIRDLKVKEPKFYKNPPADSGRVY
ncbi:MAG: hypothetical protein AAB453_03350 [Patescibacteria group bacterium]